MDYGILIDAVYHSMCSFFFNDTATTEIYTLSLHDALPICAAHGRSEHRSAADKNIRAGGLLHDRDRGTAAARSAGRRRGGGPVRRTVSVIPGDNSLQWPATPIRDRIARRRVAIMNSLDENVGHAGRFRIVGPIKFNL